MTKVERKLYKAQELIEEAKKLIVERDKLIDLANDYAFKADDETLKLKTRLKYLFKAWKVGLEAFRVKRRVNRKIRRARSALGVFA